MTEKVGVYHCPGKRLPWVVRWFGEYNPRAGKRRRYSRAFRLKREAEDFQTDKQKELNGGGRRDKPEELTLSVFCDKFVKTRLRNHSHSSRVCYNNTIAQLKSYFGESCLLRRIDRQQAEEFIASRGDITVSCGWREYKSGVSWV